MEKEKVLTGRTEYNGVKYTFFLQGFLLTLVPFDEGKIALRGCEAERVETLFGTTITEHRICFFHVELKCSLWGEIKTYISGYILGKNNIQDGEINTFSAMTFRGSVVDKYYNPIRKFDSSASSFDYESGSSIRALKPFKDSDCEIELVPHLFMQFGVSNPPLPSSTNLNLGELHSYLRLYTDCSWSPNSIINLYLRIYHLFVFISFRRNITFDNITLSRQMPDGKLHPVAELFVASSEQCTTIEPHRTILHEDIGDKIANLYRMNPFDKFLQFIPKNDKTAQILDSNVYLNACAAFESLYDLIYGEYISKDDDHEEVKRRIVSALYSIVDEYTDNKRTEAKAFLRTIEEMDEKTLKNKFKTVIREYVDVLKAVFPKINFNKRYINNISYQFANQRNNLAHGNIEILTEMEIPPYSYALCLIYVLMLSKLAEIPSAQIPPIVKKLFGRYIVA